jgi:hypothetical protein
MKRAVCLLLSPLRMSICWMPELDTLGVRLLYLKCKASSILPLVRLGSSRCQQRLSLYYGPRGFFPSYLRSKPSSSFDFNIRYSTTTVSIMAPIIHDSEIEQRLLLTDRFDNRPLNPSDGDSATELLESHRPLPTTYLLALSQDLPKGAGLEYHTPPLGDTQGEALYYPDNVGHCESTIMGFADSVMTPLTAQVSLLSFPIPSADYHHDITSHILTDFSC